MHERALMRDLWPRSSTSHAPSGRRRVTRVDVRLGAFSHFTADHFREHFADLARHPRRAPSCTRSSTVTCATRATGVVLESLEVESMEVET